MATNALLNSFAPPPTGGSFDDFVPPAPTMRRFAVTVPLAMLTLVAMVFSSRFFPSSLPPPPHYDVVMATIVEPPPPPPVPAGLQGGAAPAAKPAAKPVHHVPRAHPHLPPPVLATSPSGGIAVPVPAAPPSIPKEDTSGISGGTGVGGGSGVGTDSAGARAIYAPPPKIPDDLRQDAMQAEAMAHFVVAPDGTVTVTLVKPTGNPRLNQVLLAALSQWQFFPAMRSGTPVPSEFDLRIPIVVE